jgi:hypothetical protein
MKTKQNTIDPTRVVDGFLFETHRDRALYIRQLVKDRSQWLKDNPHVWKHLPDVQ